jgi:hypothetical protein
MPRRQSRDDYERPYKDELIVPFDDAVSILRAQIETIKQEYEYSDDDDEINELSGLLKDVNQDTLVTAVHWLFLGWYALSEDDVAALFVSMLRVRKAWEHWFKWGPFWRRVAKILLDAEPMAARSPTVRRLLKPLDGVLEILQCRDPSYPSTQDITLLLNEAVDRIRGSKKAVQLQKTISAIERLLQDLSTAGDITKVHERL